MLASRGPAPIVPGAVTTPSRWPAGTPCLNPTHGRAASRSRLHRDAARICPSAHPFQETPERARTPCPLERSGPGSARATIRGSPPSDPVSQEPCITSLSKRTWLAYRLRVSTRRWDRHITCSRDRPHFPTLPRRSPAPGVSVGRAAISATAPAATRGKSGSTTFEHILDCLRRQPTAMRHNPGLHAKGLRGGQRHRNPVPHGTGRPSGPLAEQWARRGSYRNSGGLPL